MTLSELFAYLGAPLKNPRWSWGSVRPADGAVFLRVWQDEQRKVEGRWYTQISANQFFKDEPGNLGHAERQTQVERVRNGAPSFMIMCQASDPQAHPRSIGNYNQREVFVGGNVIRLEGDDWLARVDRRRVDKVRPSR